MKNVDKTLTLCLAALITSVSVAGVTAPVRIAANAKKMQRSPAIVNVVQDTDMVSCEASGPEDKLCVDDETGMVLFSE